MTDYRALAERLRTWPHTTAVGTDCPPLYWEAAAAIESLLAERDAIRAQTIEECAKVCCARVERRPFYGIPVFTQLTGEECAAAIRALSSSTPEGGKE